MKPMRIAAIVLFLGLSAWFISRPISYVANPKPTPTPRVGDLGSNVNQVQQRDFDGLLEKLNTRIDFEHNAQNEWERCQEQLIWPTVIVHILLIAFAWISGSPPPSQPAGNGAGLQGNGNVKRSWQSWVMLILAIIAMAIQAFNEQFEAKKNEKAGIVKRLYEATSQARIAFADAKTAKEYDSAIEILRKADLDIK